MPYTKMSGSCAPIYSKERKAEVLDSAFFNVIDEYKSLTTNEIKEKLKENKLPYAVCMQNFISEYNFGTFVRSSNAFSAEHVYYLGQKKWDRRSSLGSHIYQDITFLEEESHLERLKSKYKFVAVDNLPGAISIYDYKFEPNCLFLFGSEGEGLLPSVSAMCEEMIYIPQTGSIRSLNVGCASAIIMNAIHQALLPLKNKQALLPSARGAPHYVGH